MKQKTITSTFEIDHDRLDELLKEFQAFKRIDYPKAKEFFKEFRTGLRRHIVWEEEILFPLFEQKTGFTEGGPTHVMRLEHRLIGRYLEALHEKVRIQNPESDEEEKLLLSALAVHNQKEESILYPAIDHSVNDTERASVFAAMQDLPDARFAGCCADHPAKRETV